MVAVEGEEKRLTINIVMQILAFGINIGVNFFLTPFIVNRLGTEVYGFVGFANSITNYITIFTVAINGMVGRYVTIELSKKNYEKSKEYFASVTIANIFISAVLAIPSVVFCLYIDKFINISSENLFDIQLLFFGVFMAFIISMAGSSFAVGVYSMNRLDLSSRRNAENTILRAVLLILCFTVFDPHVYFIGIASMICSVHITWTNKKYLNQYTPMLKISRKYFHLSIVKELVLSGVWNSINALSSILMTGLDLLIANLFINAEMMGMLSVAKSVPSYILSFYSMIANVFAPRMTILYGKGKMSELIKETKAAMYLCGYLVLVPIAGVIVFGEDFYRLWLNNLSSADIRQIQILSVLTLFPYGLSAFIYPLYNINTITLKLKIPVIVSLGIGVINILAVFLLLNTTDLGIYAIAGVSSFLLLCRVIFFTPLYAARNLNIKWHSFYPQLLRGGISYIILMILLGAVKKIVIISRWFDLIAVAFICAVIGYIVSAFVLFNGKEIKKFLSAINDRLLLIGRKFRNKIRNRIERKFIKNKDFTIISNNCIGGVISHDLGLKFLSPTVNLYIEPHDFVKFVSNLEFYLDQEFTEIESYKDYPVGRLYDILVYFKHYDTFDEAVVKWNERKERINYNNLFVMMTDRFFCSYEDAVAFDNLPYKNKVLLMSSEKKWYDISCGVKMKKYNDKSSGSVRIITDVVNAFGRRVYQQSGFNYIKWLNNPAKFMSKFIKKQKEVT